MQVRIGTSGYSYKEWRGSFYPEKLPAGEYLRFYGERFPTVEINNTFYRMPSKDVLGRWADETPAGFRFVLKAPRRITHEKRLNADRETVSYFLDTANALGAKLGPLLFQLPPYSKKDVARLKEFLALLPPAQAAFEFRHESWDDEEVREALRAAGAALCLADMDEDEATAPIHPTARWGYLRLRRKDYAEADLQAWAERIRAQPWDEAWVFFKHEDSGTAPAFGQKLAALLS